MYASNWPFVKMYGAQKICYLLTTEYRGAGVVSSSDDYDRSTEWSGSNVGSGDDRDKKFFVSVTGHTALRLDTLRNFRSPTGSRIVKDQVGSLNRENTVINHVPSSQFNSQRKKPWMFDIRSLTDAEIKALQGRKKYECVTLCDLKHLRNKCQTFHLCLIVVANESWNTCWYLEETLFSMANMYAICFWKKPLVQPRLTKAERQRGIPCWLLEWISITFNTVDRRMQPACSSTRERSLFSGGSGRTNDCSLTRSWRTSLLLLLSVWCLSPTCWWVEKALQLFSTV